MTLTLNFDHGQLTLSGDDPLRDATLFELAEQMNVLVPTSCLKNGKCRECLVEVTQGMALLTPRTGEESHLSGEFRLSCRTRIEPGKVGHITCHTLKRQDMRIDESGADLPLSFRDVALEPAITRQGSQVLLEGRPIAEDVSAHSRLHGIALDIGTTTVVARLMDLERGRVVAARAFENPQRFAGNNVMSRIQFDADNKGRLLQRTLLGYLSRAILSMPIDPATIYEIVVAANPTMRDLFFGLDVSSIGQNPFQSITEHEHKKGMRRSTSLETTAKRLRLPIHPQARVWSLPLLGSHVGADAAAGLLAIDVKNQTQPFMLMDVGTNTEIICGNNDRLLIASCPAGPAFEGGSIDCGMPALSGAIERVKLKPDALPDIQVIDGQEPVGICGSGLVDLISGLLNTGQMNHHGRLTSGHRQFDLRTVPSIYLSEHDISELAQAKGANQAGCRILLKRFGLEVAGLNRLYLAGGFARHLDVDAARNIGLIPNLASNKVVQVGNVALEGATIALLSLTQRAGLEDIMKRIEHVQLEEESEFFNFYTDGCIFQEVSRV
jgi:uncharacterized 2Fe-2S/4Fe-4S cluster protein (DUF4445 family)